MTFYNRVILSGKVASPPRRHYLPNGSPIIQFPLELDVTRKPRYQEQPDGARRSPLNPTGSGSLIEIVATGKLAEFHFDLLQQDQHLLVRGRLNQRQWRTPEGKHRTCTEVIATDLRTLEERDERGEKNEETF
jgi:single-stranded DNA-binding protein